MTSDNLKGKTVKGLIWSSIDRGGQQVLAFVVGIILVNLITPTDYGLIGSLAIFTALSTTLIDSGFGNSLIKEKEEPSSQDYSTVFFFNIGISFFLYLVLCLCGPLIADFFNQPSLNMLSKWVFLPILFNALGLIQQTQLIRKVLFKKIARISLTSLLFSGLLAIVSALCGWGVYALIVQTLSFSLIRTGMLWYFSGWYPVCSFQFATLKRYSSYGSNIALVGILNCIFTNLYSTLIGRFYPIQQVAFYTYAKKIHDIPSSAISLSLQDVTFPVLSKISHDAERFVRALRKTIRTSSFLLFPVMWGLAAVSEGFFTLLLPSQWLLCVPMLQILCSTAPFLSLCVVNNNLLTTSGLSALFLRVELFKKVLLVIALLVTVNLGVLAMIVGFAVYNLIAYLVSATVSGRIVNYGLWAQLKDLAPYLLMSLAMVVIITLPGLLIVNQYILFPLQILLGGTVYLSLCQLLGSKVYSDILTELKNRIYGKHS